MRTKLLFVLSCIAVVLYSCSDSTVQTDFSNITISGTVKNLNSDIKRINAIVVIPEYPFKKEINSSAISASGSFTLNMKKLNDSLLNELTFPSSDSQCTGNITLNPSGIRCADIVFEAANASNSVIGYIERRNYDNALVPGSFYSWYCYFDKDVKITGSQLCSNETDTSLYKCNVSAVKGWNKVTGIFDELSPSKVTYSFTSSEPAGADWYFYSYSDMKTKKEIHFKELIKQ